MAVIQMRGDDGLDQGAAGARTKRGVNSLKRHQPLGAARKQAPPWPPLLAELEEGGLAPPARTRARSGMGGVGSALRYLGFRVTLEQRRRVLWGVRNVGRKAGRGSRCVPWRSPVQGRWWRLSPEKDRAPDGAFGGPSSLASCCGGAASGANGRTASTEEGKQREEGASSSGSDSQGRVLWGPGNTRAGQFGLGVMTHRAGAPLAVTIPSHQAVELFAWAVGRAPLGGRAGAAGECVEHTPLVSSPDLEAEEEGGHRGVCVGGPKSLLGCLLLSWEVRAY